MLSTILDEILGPHSKVSVLRVLFRDDGLSGREVARRAGLSPRAASLALARLVGAGVVRRRQVGTTHLFSLDRRRRIVSRGLGGLFAEEEEWAGRVGRDILRALGERRCACVAVFGSFARGEGRPQSDLDVLTLLTDPARVGKARAVLERESARLSEAFGIRVSPYVIGVAEFARRLRRGDALMRGLAREARVIAGKPLAEVLVDES